MPIEEVLRALAEENFDGSNYYPVSHGQTQSIKPLALVVKKPRSVLKRPFARSEFIVIAALNDYVVKDKRGEFSELVSSTLLKEENLRIAEDEAEDDGAKSSVDVRLEAGKCVKVNVKIADVLGELILGKLDQEYIKDPDLRELLDMTALDVKRMESLEDQKLRLIYSVIYSEKFELKGKREHELQADGSIDAPVPEVFEWLTKHTQLGAHYKKKTTPSKVATRYSRGPIFFKLVRVDYDKDQGRLKVSEGEFPGHEVKSGDRATERIVDNAEEYAESIVGSAEEENYLAESLTDEDKKKLGIIKDSVLKSAENREIRKERVKKYLSWFEEALITDKKKLSLVEPLTVEDRKFLQSIFSPVFDQSTVDLSKFDTEKIQGYAIVFKQIDDLSDVHWDEIEKAWA